MKTCCGNGTLQKVSRGVLATARQFGLYYAVSQDLSVGWPNLIVGRFASPRHLFEDHTSPRGGLIKRATTAKPVDRSVSTPIRSLTGSCNFLFATETTPVNTRLADSVIMPVFR